MELQKEIVRRALDALAMHASINEDAEQVARAVADRDSIEHAIFRIAVYCGSTATVQTLHDNGLIKDTP